MSNSAQNERMSTEQNGTREQTLADYFAVVRRYKVLIVLAALIVPVVAYLYSAQQPKVFRASSEVLLNRDELGSVITGLPTANTVSDPERYARTQAALARVPAVAQLALERSGTQGMAPFELLDSSEVTPRADTDLLVFAVHHGDHDVAAALATAYAYAFTKYKLQMDTTSLIRARQELQKRLVELRRQGATDTTTYRELVQQSQNLQTLEILQVPASVVREARGSGQIAPTPKRNAMLGVMLGLMIGIGGAFLMNALDRRIRSADELERELQIPLLAKLPAPRRRGDRLTILDRPPDEVSEAVSRLRTSFDFANAEAQAKVVMATSAGAQEGKSTTIANLAVALSRTGRHVVLVDLDIRRPSLARLFHLPDGPGMTEVASGKVDLSTALNPVSTVPLRARVAALRDAETNVGVLEVITAGRLPVEPGEFVETAGLTNLLQQLRSRAEIVLVDAPPILATGDAMALTGKVDAILLINRLGALTRPTLRELLRALDRSPAPLLGFVATGAEADEGYLLYRAEEEAARSDDRSRMAEDERSASQDIAAASASGASGRWAPRRRGT
jgi:capsular exopolysaccharide synthesis family protein